MANNRYDVVVIGAGIIGAAVAYYLSEEKLKVLLLEKDTPASGASGACNGGLSCLGKKGHLLDIALESLRLYRQLSREILLPAEIDMEREILFVARKDREMELLAEAVRVCQQRGVPAALLNTRNIRRRYPFLKGDIVGGAAAGGGLHGYVNPFSLIFSFINRVRKNGGSIIKEKKATGIITEAGKITGVRTDNGLYRTELAVLCTGYRADRLLASYDFSAGVQPVKGTVLVTEATDFKPGVNILAAGFLEHNDKSDRKVNIAIEQTISGNLLLGSSAEEGTDTAVNISIAREIASGAVSLIPRLAGINIIRSYTGIRPVRERGPYLGQVPGIDGLYTAAGFGGMGITLAPYAGRKIASDIK